jgi:hypothetical protein
MSNTPGFETLRAKYRSEWDAYQVLAHNNLQLVHAGKRPSDEDLQNEKRVAAAVQAARDALLAAIARLGQ